MWHSRDLVSIICMFWRGDGVKNNWKKNALFFSLLFHGII